MNLKRILFPHIILLFVACFLSCENNSVSNEKDKEVTKKIQPPKKKAPIVVKKEDLQPLITDENVTEFLTQYGEENLENNALIYTSFGLIRAKLYKDTPLHRASFILWAKKGFYNGSVFMRVTPNFIAQGGTTSSDKQMNIKKEIGTYTIPSEFRKHRYHKQGAIGMARRYEGNPTKRSDSHRFYFVEGTTYNRPTLAHYEKTQDYTYSQEQLDFYTSGNKGAAHIDGEHTVFGELVSGQEVVKKLTEVQTDSRDWPLKDIFIDSVIVF